MDEKKPGPKRSRAQGIRDRTTVVRMWAQGKREWEIAEFLEVSQQQVSADLRRGLALFQAQIDIDHKEACAKELARLDALEAEYWRAWFNSLTGRKAEETLQDNLDPDKPKLTIRLRKETREGNADFLKGVGWCIDRRCKLLGLDAPSKIDIEVRLRKIAEENGLDPDAAVKEAMQILASGGLVW